ncbi:hypothetical protein BOTCAL_0054g00030 [Botryotinia calthae]|uniref:Uncharacterized protein n=1 Tax=Botryotinia calthae TaxID=38488 RepID=A0A4Y8DAH8_9HELO|nr:hypothetical protein BOTCAL_0054g00030 [Botryotinia calthae]
MEQESEASSRQRIVVAEREASTGIEGLASKVDRDPFPILASVRIFQQRTWDYFQRQRSTVMPKVRVGKGDSFRPLSSDIGMQAHVLVPRVLLGLDELNDPYPLSRKNFTHFEHCTKSVPQFQVTV